MPALLLPAVLLDSTCAMLLLPATLLDTACAVLLDPLSLEGNDEGVMEDDP